MENKIIITNIQRLCLHDGPGVRTTIFLKGCSIRCPWCANPETISPTIQHYIDKNICCKKDGIPCKYNSLCTEKCIDQIKCNLNAIKTYGYEITEKDLFDEIIKDVDFFEQGGGVTFSGGEPLLQIDKYDNLLLKLKENNINVLFETALFVPSVFLKKAMQYTNDFIVDVKILDKEKCKNILNGNVDLYYENIKILFENEANVVLRIPLSNEYTLEKENKNLILDLLKKYRPKKVEIFKLHSLAQKKYNNLKIEQRQFSNITDDDINDFVQDISKLKIDVEILKM